MKAYLIRRMVVGLTFLSLLATACQSKAGNPFPELKEWDLLIISDSANWGVGQYYADLIEEEIGVTVNLSDCWVGSLTARKTLTVIREGRGLSFLGGEVCMTPWRDLIKEAEVMVLQSGPQESHPANGAWDTPINMDTCVEGGYEDWGTDPATIAANKAQIQANCAPETWSAYIADLEAILDEIETIREGRPLILRMTDHYVPDHPKWKKYGVDDVCTACFDNFVAAIHQAAESHGVTVIKTIDAFNGKDHKQDPGEKGYIGGDGFHLSDKGRQLVAKLLIESGFDY